MPRRGANGLGRAPDRFVWNLHIDQGHVSPYVSAMAKLDIITLPDPLLRQRSAPIEQMDDQLRRLMDDMLETMYIAPGIGLAAVQVAVPRRLLVVDVGAPEDQDDDDDEFEDGFDNYTAGNADDDDYAAEGAATAGRKVSGASLIGAAEGKDPAPKKEPVRNPICMVNPKILRLGDRTRAYEEGCLSLPDVLVEIERPTSLSVQYIDRDGTEQILEASGLLATVIQHEVDHLDGKLIVDFMSRLKRDMVIRKFKKLKR